MSHPARKDPSVNPQMLLAPYRAQIDALDVEILGLLAKRLQIVHDVSVIKKQHGIPAVLPDRVQAVIEGARARAKALNVDPDLAADLYERIVAYCCAMEERYFKGEGENT